MEMECIGIVGGVQFAVVCFSSDKSAVGFYSF
jgi:hypothetical protein